MNTTTPLRTLAALVVCALFAACGSDSPTGPIGNNYVVLVDISASALKDLEGHAADIEQKLLRSMGPKDRLTILAIDDASETFAKALFQLDMAAKDFVNKSLPVTVRKTVADQDRAAYMDSVLSGFGDALRSAAEERRESAKYTDIFGAFTMARKQARPTMTNHLLVLSDMVHEGHELNFERSLRKSADLQQLLPNVPEAELPFQHVLVYTGNNTELGQEKFRAVQAFWTSWFAQYNVPLRDYTSGGITMDFTRYAAR